MGIIQEYPAIDDRSCEKFKDMIKIPGHGLKSLVYITYSIVHYYRLFQCVLKHTSNRRVCNSIKYVYLQIPEEKFSAVKFQLLQKAIVLTAL